MGTPAFTEAELRRAMKVAGEFGATVEVCPRKGTIRIVRDSGVTVPEREGKSCDDIFGTGSE